MGLVNLSKASYKHLPMAGVTLQFPGAFPLKMDLLPNDTSSLSGSALINFPRQ